MRRGTRASSFSRALSVFILFAIVFVMCSFFSIAASWITPINTSKVSINTTYEGEPVYLDDLTGQDSWANITRVSDSYLYGSTTAPVNPASQPSNTYITISSSSLPNNNYLFQILARDYVGNFQYANMSFDIDVPEPPPPPGCGDGVVSGAEECDDGCLSYNNPPGCDAEPLENGDGCTTQCKEEVCGNNKADPGEECDGSDLNGMGCTDLGHFSGGTLDCDPDTCMFDIDGCYEPIEECGNGVIDPGEQCDDDDWGNIYDCTDFDFTSGALQCVDCEFDTDDCQGNTGGYCGDGKITVGEQCDGSNWGDEISECADFDYFTGGDLECSGCSFDTDDCTKPTPYCGNGIVDGDDICDDQDWADIEGCEDFEAFDGGILTCDSTCHFDTIYCTSSGNGINESCYDDDKNGDETDTDCGGGCPGCANGDVCLIDGDCLSYYCKNNICTAPSCTDDIKNGLETDTDCGGNCDPCPGGSNCSINSDCSSMFCNPDSKKCETPSCTDGYPNGDESDTDCGGGCPNKCSAGQNCRTGSDCKTGFCDSLVCSYDPTLDTDGDGMPDKWEDANGLDPNDASDADGDLDRDGHSNLDEYLDGTDPNDPYDPLPEKKRTLQIILLILGLLLMILGTAFLIYSRKVLIPQQMAARRKAMPQRPMMQPGQQQGQQARRPIPPGRGRGAGAGRVGGRPLRRRPSPSKSARKSIMSKFGEGGAGEDAKKSSVPRTPSAEIQAPAQKAKTGPKPGSKPESKKPSEEFVPISKIGKKQEAQGPSKKPLGGAFGKLKELTKEAKAEGETPTSALKELSSEPKKKEKPDKKGTAADTNTNETKK